MARINGAVSTKPLVTKGSAIASKLIEEKLATSLLDPEDRKRLQIAEADDAASAI